MQNFPKNHIRIGTLVQADGEPDKTVAYIEKILDHGFESFQLVFWKTLGDTDIIKLADKVNAVLAGRDAIISSIGLFGNPLESDEESRETLRGCQNLIEHAQLFGCDTFAGFTGRLRAKPIHQCIDCFKEVWTPLAEQAMDKKVKIAFENCAMGGTWDYGDWNIAHNPTAWELMFDAIPLDNLGLCWEPCHQMRSLIDPLAQLREWCGRMFLIHGKDANIDWDIIRKYGVFSCSNEEQSMTGKVKVPDFAYDRFPGFGDCDWTEIIHELQRGAYSGSIDIEGWHDPIYKDNLEMSGQLHALNYLKKCREAIL
jgi:sugar phosphate isomerase/epimerase